jgi:hypothetical protein
MIMMKFILSAWLPATIALLLTTSISAQTKKNITVKAGNKIADVLSLGDIFYFPQFTFGQVFFKDGTKAEAKLNYNHLVDEMQFIDSKKDTLSLANENTIRFIAVDKDTFFYNNGYHRLILQSEGIKLTHRQVWTLGDVKKIGAFNQANSTGAITTFSSLEGKGGSYHLVQNEDIDIRKAEQYFLGDRYNQFSLANKKNVLDLYSKDQQTIKTYFKENKVDFSKLEDLEKLTRFLSQL